MQFEFKWDYKIASSMNNIKVEVFYILQGYLGSITGDFYWSPMIISLLGVDILFYKDILQFHREGDYSTLKFLQFFSNPKWGLRWTKGLTLRFFELRWTKGLSFIFIEPRWLKGPSSIFCWALMDERSKLHFYRVVEDETSRLNVLSSSYGRKV